MGYGVGAHLVLVDADWERLAALPGSLTWTVRRHAGFFGIDVQRAWKASSEPYGAMRLKDLAEEVPSSFAELAALRSFLAEHDEEGAFPVAPFDLGVQLSHILGVEALTLWADDDSYDFASVSTNGAPTRLRVGGYGLEATWMPGKCTVVPLEQEDGEAPPTIELEGLRAQVPNARVAPVASVEPGLHRVAREEALRFVGGNVAPLGLGSFDGDLAPAEVVARRPE
ncbi:MAG: hypothetical protein JJ863_09485 [Deltaproteobacteria bacterium]|nr:hypothetical protein [Deltaproteobacteria bacterium]